ncbi:MAG TPA: ElyC/SanA/YdcF family protein [Terriglobales bacterium]
MHKKASFFISGALLLAAGLACAGRFLVVDRPGRADLIVVLAGEDSRRPERGLQLLHAGDASRMFLDVPANAKIYQSSKLELAQSYIQKLPEANAIRLCPITALSTRGEVHDVEQCLSGVSPHTVLLVTSDYHSRRALSTFEKLLPRYQYRMASASDPATFGVNWWEHREWAKTMLAEWCKLIWWQAVDRWRN